MCRSRRAKAPKRGEQAQPRPFDTGAFDQRRPTLLQPREDRWGFKTASRDRGESQRSLVATRFNKKQPDDRRRPAPSMPLRTRSRLRNFSTIWWVSSSSTPSPGCGMYPSWAPSGLRASAAHGNCWPSCIFTPVQNRFLSWTASGSLPRISASTKVA